MQLENRDYQDRVVSKTIDLYNQGLHSILIESPTGSGKSIMGLRVAQHFEQQGKKVIWVAMRRNLLRQIADFNRQFFGLENLTPVSMFDKNPPEADVMIIDEGHHDAAASCVALHAKSGAKSILGLSATPFRTDKLKLAFQRTVKDAGVHRLIQEGYLSPFHHYSMEEYSPRSVAETYLADPDRWGKTVVFFHRIDQCMEFKHRLRQDRVYCEVVTGQTKREEQLDDFDEGKFRVVANVMVLTEGFDCLTSDTEILTPDGWKGKGQIQKDDSVYGLNRETGKLEIVNVDSYGERQTKPGEKIVHFKSQHIDLPVTEGHRIHFKYRDPAKNGKLSDKFVTRKAIEMVGRKSAFALPLSAELVRPNCIRTFKGLTRATEDDGRRIHLTDDEIRLIAWFMTDGWLQGKHKSDLYIGQSKKEESINDIRNLLIRLGVDFTEKIRTRKTPFSDNPKPFHLFRIPKGTGSVPKNGWGYLAEYMDKDVSPLLHNMTRHEFQIFWNEAMKGDGNRHGNRSGWLWCEKKCQADAYTHMAVIRGFATACAPFTTKSGNVIWRVTARDRQWLTSTPGDERAGTITSREAKNETVWCVSNKLGTIIVRRNGKVAIIGNCPNLETVFVRDSAKLPTIQMAGRGFRTHPGKDHCNIVQSKMTRWTFTRTATPAMSLVQRRGNWYTLGSNERVNLSAHKMRRKLLELGDIEMPPYILNNRRKRKAFAHV